MCRSFGLSMQQDFGMRLNTSTASPMKLGGLGEGRGRGCELVTTFNMDYFIPVRKIEPLLYRHILDYSLPFKVKEMGRVWAQVYARVRARVQTEIERGFRQRCGKGCCKVSGKGSGRLWTKF